MITNLIDKFYLSMMSKQALQTGSAIRHDCTVFLLTVCMQEQVEKSDQDTDC